MAVDSGDKSVPRAKPTRVSHDVPVCCVHECEFGPIIVHCLEFSHPVLTCTFSCATLFFFGLWPQQLAHTQAQLHCFWMHLSPGAGHLHQALVQWQFQFPQKSDVFDLSRMSGVSRIKCWTLLMIPVAKKLAKPFLIADHTAKILFDQGLFFFPLLHFRTTPTNSTALINDAESKDPPKIDSAVISCHDCATDSTIEPWFERPLTTSRRLQHPEPSKTIDPPLGKGTFPPPCAFSTSMPTKANFCNHLNGAFVVESGSDRLISTIWKVKCIIANTEIAEASKANCLSIVHCMSIVYLK